MAKPKRAQLKIDNAINRQLLQRQVDKKKYCTFYNSLSQVFPVRTNDNVFAKRPHRPEDVEGGFGDNKEQFEVKYGGNVSSAFNVSYAALSASVYEHHKHNNHHAKEDDHADQVWSYVYPSRGALPRVLVVSGVYAYY